MMRAKLQIAVVVAAIFLVAEAAAAVPAPQSPVRPAIPTSGPHLRSEAPLSTLVARKRKKTRKKKPDPEPVAAPAPAPAPAPAAAPEPAPSADAGGSPGPRSNRIDFEAQMIKGQTTKAGEVQILERKDTELKSMVKRRESFRKEIINSVFPEK